MDENKTAVTEALGAEVIEQIKAELREELKAEMVAEVAASQPKEQENKGFRRD